MACLDHPCAWLSPAAERAVAERQGRSVSVPSGADPLETIPRTDVSVARVDGEPVFVLSGAPSLPLRARRAQPRSADLAAERGQLGPDHAARAGG